MSDTSVLEKVSKHGVIPVIAIENEAAALPLADALLEGGLPIAEITFRTKAAAAVMAKLSKERPEVLLGAGTVLTNENVEAAKNCGATFAVAPGLNPSVVKHAQSVGLPFVPGIATPSDIEGALALGCTTLKFFPAGALGGASMLKALAGPYGHTGVRFVPTGGVNTENLADYLSMKVIAACGGTWIAKKEDLENGNWAAITERCKQACDIVAKVRG